MIESRVRRMLILATATGALLGALSCSKTETTRVQPPTFIADEVVTQAGELVNQGYDQLDSNNLEGAVAAFAQVGELIPNGLADEYHTACAYARTGDKEQAFVFLTRMVDNGFDEPDNLRYDSDFQVLVDDARFDQLLSRARANFETAAAAFANGMPEYATPPQTFATEEELDAWADEQTRALRQQSRFWTSSDYIAARMDFAARRLSALRALKADDPEFDYGLERVQAAVRLKSPYETGWGAVSDLVKHEADSYLAAATGDGQSEANYLTGLAVSLKYAKDDANRMTGYTAAGSYLNQVAEGTEYYAAAQGLKIINQLRAPNADEAVLGPQLKAIIEEYPDDQKLFRAVSTQTENAAARFLWPLPLDQADLKNKAVSLDGYKGKALLIDFWATWCPPCRAELPNIVEVYKEYNPKGLEIVSISLDYADDTPTEAYQTWIDSAGMTWRHIYDGEGWNTPLVKRFFVGSIPAPFLVGKDGSLVAWGEDLRGENLTASVKTALGI